MDFARKNRKFPENNVDCRFFADFFRDFAVIWTMLHILLVMMMLASSVFVDSETATRVYISGVLDLKVEPQLNGDNLEITNDPEIVNQYSLAKGGTVALMAHNYLAGQYFYQIREGDVVLLDFRDGHSRKYVVTDIIEFQRLNLLFISTETLQVYSERQFLNTFFQSRDYLVFMTCLEKSGNVSWGVTLFIALPLADEIVPCSIRTKRMR